MAVNKDETNKLYAVNDTGVKFFSSLTRALAKGEAKFVYNGEETDINSFPGAICYVSDDKGNSIFLNKLLFGDGAHASSADSTSGGSSGSGGITEVSLDIIPVVEKDGEVLKTLADYFNADGTFLTNSLNITKTAEDGTILTLITIDNSGIKIGNDTVVTQTLLDGISSSISAAKSEAEAYADSLITSVYKVKGTKDTYSDLLNIKDLKEGDVWNVKSELKSTDGKTITPAGTNYVWTGIEWDAIGGTFDVSSFYTKSEVDNAIFLAITENNNSISSDFKNLQDQITSNTTAIGTLSNDITTNATNIATNTTNIATNTSNIEQNTTNITNISTQLTWQ